MSTLPPRLSAPSTPLVLPWTVTKERALLETITAVRASVETTYASVRMLMTTVARLNTATTEALVKIEAVNALKLQERIEAIEKEMAAQIEKEDLEKLATQIAECPLST